MKKIKKPQLKVVKFQPMDVIATSGVNTSSAKPSANTSSITYTLVTNF